MLSSNSFTQLHVTLRGRHDGVSRHRVTPSLLSPSTCHDMSASEAPAASEPVAAAPSSFHGDCDEIPAVAGPSSVPVKAKRPPKRGSKRSPAPPKDSSDDGSADSDDCEDNDSRDPDFVEASPSNVETTPKRTSKRLRATTAAAAAPAPAVAAAAAKARAPRITVDKEAFEKYVDEYFDDVKSTKARGMVKKLFAAGFKWEEDEAGRCAMAGLMKGLFVFNGTPAELDAPVILKATGKPLEVKCNVSVPDCPHTLRPTLRELLTQPDYAGLDYEDDLQDATVRCREPGCKGAVYVTDMCSGKKCYADSGKFHNHCKLCPFPGKCIGDYREQHCHRCGDHFFGGFYEAYPCNNCGSPDGSSTPPPLDEGDDEVRTVSCCEAVFVPSLWGTWVCSARCHSPAAG